MRAGDTIKLLQMSDHNNKDSMFGDELGLDDRFTAHSGTTRVQTPTVLLAGAQVQRPHAQRSVAAKQQQTKCLPVVAKYDLMVNPEAFAKEQILRRSLANCNKVLSTLSAQEASHLLNQDKRNNVKSWSVDHRHHGGFQDQFDELLGSMGVAAVDIQVTMTKTYTVDEKPERAAHQSHSLGDL